MKLLYSITLRISVAMLVLFAIWAYAFYYIMVSEINDETDDTLEDYSEYIIARALAGERLPERDNGTNNSYHITEVDAAYAAATPAVQYLDEMVYLYSKKETEPARVHKSIFMDRQGRYYELTVMIPTIEKEDLLSSILLWIIILYIILLIALISVNAWVLRRSLRPLYALLDWLGKLRLGSAIPETGFETHITEFRELHDALVLSAQRNAEMYEQQSLFIGHASHELQTPLAIAGNRLEILSNDAELSEAQLEEIMKTRRTLDELSRLNKTLLLLTKIENRQFPESSNVDVNALLRKLSDDFAEAYGYLDIRLSIREDARVAVSMNESLASTLFRNIVKNAYVHNREGGRVDIRIKPHGVEVRNTATAGALNPDYIFRRFYHDTGKKGAVGLGLSIVESICRLYGFGIAYRYDDGAHLFDINMPE